MRPIISEGILWSLHKNGKTAQAVAREIEDVGVELRYLWDGELMLSCLFRDGSELIAEATAKRFELEGRGWVVPTLSDD